jgi:hypothetical protein
MAVALNGLKVETLPLAIVAAACRLETDCYLRGEHAPGHACRELFRRAVRQRDDDAWRALFAQYRPLVLAWVRRHPAAAGLDLADDDWVALTFARFFGGVRPGEFGTFAAAAQLLQYLKLCVHSAVLDEARARRRTAAERLDEALPDRRPDVEAAAVDAEAARRLWEAIMARTSDEGERVVARLCLAGGLKPREVQARHPALFPAVTDVYRRLRNLRERLARDPAIRGVLAG